LRVLTLTRDIGHGFGGAEKIAFEFATRLDPERFRSYACITRAPTVTQAAQTDEDLAELSARGIEVLRLERTSSAAVLPWLRLYRWMRARRFDVVHAHMPRASIPGTVVGRLARVPVIVSQEHIWSTHRTRERQFLHRAVVGRFSDALLAVSERNRDNIIEVERIPPDRILVLPNGIAPLGPVAGDPRGELDVPADRLLIGAIGRLTWEKGHVDLIQAIAAIAPSSPTVQCVIVGGGPEEQRLTQLIDDLGVGEHVRLVGQREDARQLLSAFDVAVLPSRTEGSPVALLEYMAAGAPIVATDVGGIPELIEDGVHGLLVPPQDPGQLATAIERLIHDRALAARLGGAARERQSTEFNLSVVVRRLEGIYLDLLEARG
jgi:glycosyltransferase involved in cell wall biosynthesis